MARSHPISPGAINADSELCTGVGLTAYLNGASRDSDLLFLGQAEDVTARRAVYQVPQRHPAPIPLYHLLDIFSHQPADGFAISFPERDPIRQRSVAEFNQRPHLDGQARPARPGEPGVEVFPAILALRRSDLLP